MIRAYVGRAIGDEEMWHYNEVSVKGIIGRRYIPIYR